ncbi:MAG: glutathione S-transferase family protein, partial [Gammaproteobacteria bacterium]
MNDTPLVLYDALNSPAGRRARITLLEKGLRAEIHWLNLALMEQKRPEYLRINPNGTVPALRHGSETIFESSVICEYLDAIGTGPRLMPSDPRLQRRLREWIAYEQEWARPFREAIYETYARERLRASGITAEELPARIGANTDNPAWLHLAQSLLVRGTDHAVLADRVAILTERLGWMETQLADDRPWLLGDAFSLADITLAPRIAMFPFIGIIDIAERFPRIGRCMERMHARGSWEPSGHLPAPGVTHTTIGRG